MGNCGKIMNLDINGIKNRRLIRLTTCLGGLFLFDVGCFRYESDYGNQLLNKETGIALRAGSGVNWRFNDAHDMIIDLRHGRALDRGWHQADGVTPGTWDPHGAINQRWTVENVE